jgi:hypothetical protein
VENIYSYTGLNLRRGFRIKRSKEAIVDYSQSFILHNAVPNGYMNFAILISALDGMSA